jgi:hypothetical protein
MIVQIVLQAYGVEVSVVFWDQAGHVAWRFEAGIKQNRDAPRRLHHLCLKLLSALSSPFAKHPISGFERHSVPN